VTAKDKAVVRADKTGFYWGFKEVVGVIDNILM
jgi:hypothetical protein